MTDTDYDIAIIGAGAAGLSCAYFLSRGAKVLVLEREDQPAYHSSGRSAAMYIEGYENPTVAALTSAGRDFFFSPPRGFTDQALLHPRGGLTVAGPNEGAKLAKYFDVWRSLCPELHEISIAQALELVPALKQSWLTGAVYDPSWYSIDVHELLSGYQKGIKANGGTILCNAEVKSLTAHDGGWQIVHHQGNSRAGLVINASGAWANHTAQLLGLPNLPLTPMRRTAVIIPAPENAQDWPLVHTINENLYFKPESPGLMLSPQDETPSLAVDAQPEELDVALVIDQLTQIANIEVPRVLSQWAGLRTFTPDRHPVVGHDPRCPNFFWLAGLGGFGIQTSPGLGECVANCLLENQALDTTINVDRLV